MQKLYSIILCLQAIGDPGQGWGNAVIYVLLSPIVRRKLMSSVYHACLKSMAGWIASMANTTYDEEQDLRPRSQDQERRRLLHNSSGTDLVSCVVYNNTHCCCQNIFSFYISIWYVCAARHEHPSARLGSSDFVTPASKIEHSVTSPQNKTHTILIS